MRRQKRLDVAIITMQASFTMSSPEARSVECVTPHGECPGVFVFLPTSSDKSPVPSARSRGPHLLESALMLLPSRLPFRPRYQWSRVRSIHENKHVVFTRPHHARRQMPCQRYEDDEDPMLFFQMIAQAASAQTVAPSAI